MCKYWVIDKENAIKKAKDEILKEMIDDRTSNPHGSGIYFYNAKKNKLFVDHWYGKTPDDVVEKIVENCLENFTKGSLLVYHNRFATSGSESKSQCHPIPIDHCDEYGNNMFKGWYIIHNGVLPKYEVEGINNISDTQIVGRVLGQWMYDHDIKSPSDFGNKRWKEFWEVEFAGSKVTIVYKNQFYTINSNLGVVEDGMWKSASKTVVTYGCSYNDCSGGYDWYNEDYKGYKEVVVNGQKYYTYSDEEDCNALDTIIPDYDPKNKNK